MINKISRVAQANAFNTPIEHIPRRPYGNTEHYDNDQVLGELVRCEADSRETVFGLIYWLINYCRIFSVADKAYIPFEIWDTPIQNNHDDNQVTALKTFVEKNRVICLKARQVGLTTLVIAYFLYEMLFHPRAFCLLLSRGENEAQELLKKMKEMYERLPLWMQSEVTVNTKSEWRLANGSVVFALSSARGDSYSATHVLIDEAALLYRSNISLNQVLLNLEPTTGLTGKLFLVSKADKSRPVSTFNSMFHAAYKKKSDYTACFVPYYVVPGRTVDWYKKKKADSMSMDGTLDFVYETYPENPEQALAPKSTNKRLHYKWVNKNYIPIEENDIITPEKDSTIPAINGIEVYKKPEFEKNYIVTADPAEGNETSDPSSITVVEYVKIVEEVVDEETGKAKKKTIRLFDEVASFNLPVDPKIFGSYLNQICEYYNNAKLLYELNEHGHALKLWLEDHGSMDKLQFEGKEGWKQNARTKPLMYDVLSPALIESRCTIRSLDTFNQLLSIESTTLKAPKGMNDDKAVTFALAVCAGTLCYTGFTFATVKVG